MDGIGGRPGWAWIFLLEGLATIVIGCVCFIIMPDTPQLSGRWLTEPEIRYLTIQTFIKEGGSSAMEKADKFRWSQLWELITDYKVYLQAWILFTASVCSYGKSSSTWEYPSGSQSLTFPMCYRSEIHDALHYQIHGLHLLGCATDDHPAVRRGRYRRGII